MKFSDLPRRRLAEMIANVSKNFEMTISKGFYDTMKHVLFLNRLMGLFPIVIRRDQDDFYKLKWSWLKVIVNNLCATLFATLILGGLISSYGIEEVYNIRLKGMSAFVSTMAEVVVMIGTWVIAQVSISMKFQEFWTYLLCVTKCDAILGPTTPTKKPLFITIILLTMTITCLGLDIYMWAHIVVPLVGAFTFIWQLVPFYVTYLFTMIFKINFWITTRAIAIRTSNLNWTLARHVNARLLSERKMFKLKINALPLKCLMTAYGHLVEASEALNNLYGLTMIATLFNIVVCLVITPYILYQQIRNSQETEFVFTQSYWMACHVLRLFFLVESCQVIEQEGMRLKKLLLKVLQFDLPPEVHRQVKSFLLLVSENPIACNARGIVVVNRTLLPAIGAAVFTYLAILFQYKNDL